jgi:hypothetical protein
MDIFLPPMKDREQDWQDFELGLAASGLSVRIIDDHYRSGSGVLIEVNTRAEAEENLVIDFVQMCFGQVYQV